MSKADKIKRAKLLRKYKQYLDFIISHELSIEEDGRTLNLTVMTDLTESLLNNHFDSKK